MSTGSESRRGSLSTTSRRTDGQESGVRIQETVGNGGARRDHPGGRLRVGAGLQRRTGATPKPDPPASTSIVGPTAFPNACGRNATAGRLGEGVIGMGRGKPASTWWDV